MDVNEMDEVDKTLTTLIQDEFPLVEDPYTELAKRGGLDVSGEEVRERLEKLKKAKVIRQIGAIFDSRNMGYKSSLVAVQAKPDEIEKVAKFINKHPGVSHNYKREHEFNIWYTIAVPPGEDLEKHVNALHEKSGALVTRILPTLKLYKIGVKLNLKDTSPEAATSKEKEGGVWNKHLDKAVEMSKEDIAAVRVLQPDLKLIPEPYKPLAEKMGVSQQELFAKVKELQERAVLRRYAGILHHRKAGFRSNGMGVWAVPEETVDEMGNKMAQFKIVSHCYRRPVYEDWRYNLFTMVHGESDDDCREMIRRMSEDTGLTDYDVLFSVVEFKKTRVEYFEEEDFGWLFDGEAA